MSHETPESEAGGAARVYQSSPPALEIQGLSKAFPGTRALHEVDLVVSSGEVHALVGQNGSGKSTLIKILAGYHTPDAGASGWVRGQKLDLGNAAAARSAGLHFVHQDLGLVDELDAIDNLALGVGYLTRRGGLIDWRRQHAAGKAILQAVGYEIDLRRPVRELAAVERTALAIARALADSDAIAALILDEPTATMSHSDVERLHEVVRRVRARGVGVLYVSHDLGEITQIADKVTVLRDGRRVGTYDVKAITQRDLVELMTGNVIDEAASHSARTESRSPVLTVDRMSGDVLTDLDVAVHAGEVVGVAGLAGSGREEVSGLIFGGRPRTGEVLIGEQKLPQCRPDIAVRLGIGFVPADRLRSGVILQMSVRENLTLSHMTGLSRRGRILHRAERKESGRWIKSLGIVTRDGESMVDELSGGNQQKVVLARSLRRNPKLMLLDEPTQGVDVAAKAQLHSLIDRAAADGMAVLICSSDEQELERLCDRVLVLRRGRIASSMERPEISAGRIARDAIPATTIDVTDPSAPDLAGPERASST